MSALTRRQAVVIAHAVEVLMPAQPLLDEGARADVRQDVVSFVTRQVQALPGFLGRPYALLTVVFDLAPLLRYGRLFRSLDAPRRAACLAAWDASAIAALRGYVKLIRSCALLAYFDHPAVLRALGTGDTRESKAMKPGAS